MAVGSRFLCRSPVKPRPARVQTPYRARPNIVQVQARPCFAFMQRPACLPACLFQARRCCFAALSVCLLSSTRSNSVHTMSETYAAAAAAATRTFPAWPAFSQFKPALVCFQTPVDGSFKLQAEHTSLGSSSSDGRTDGDDSLLAGTLQQRAGLFFSSGPSLLPLLLCRPVCLSPQQHTFKLRAHDEQDFRRSSSNSNSNNNEALSKSRRKVQPGPPPQRPAYVR